MWIESPDGKKLLNLDNVDLIIVIDNNGIGQPVLEFRKGNLTVETFTFENVDKLVEFYSTLKERLKVKSYSFPSPPSP